MNWNAEENLLLNNKHKNICFKNIKFPLASADVRGGGKLCDDQKEHLRRRLVVGTCANENSMLNKNLVTRTHNLGASGNRVSIRQ